VLLIDPFKPNSNRRGEHTDPRTVRIRRGATRTGESAIARNQPVAPAHGGIREISRRHRRVAGFVNAAGGTGSWQDS
jgi:hypothetical protein